MTTEQRQQRESQLHQAAEFGASILCCDEVLLTSDASGSVSLRGVSMCDAGYSGRTVKIVKELREKFDLARSDHNSPFAHPVCCMDPLRLTLHKIYSQHAPTKLSRVDEILSKHEGHGQLLLCALICKCNLSLVSVLSEEQMIPRQNEESRWSHSESKCLFDSAVCGVSIGMVAWKNYYIMSQMVFTAGQHAWSVQKYQILEAGKCRRKPPEHVDHQCCIFDLC